MEKSVNTYQIIFMFIMINTICNSCNGNLPGNSILRCKPLERAALLDFKHCLRNFDEHVLSSWDGKECCSWQRVSCNHTTGHVLKLHLHGTDTNYLLELEKLESLVYLIELKQLEYLELSFNNFSNSSIPNFIGSMKQLRYLNLSSSLLGGLVPHELSNLTNLRVLDLSVNEGLAIDSLAWASSLRELRYLDTTYVDLSDAHDWMESLIGPLPYLKELHLPGCQLTLDKVAHKNSTFDARLIPLRNLDLSANHLEGEIPLRLQNLTSLEYLDLSSNNLTLLTPESLHDHLRSSRTDDGNLWGLVHNLCSLRLLNVQENNLQGSFLQQRQNLSSNCRNHYDLEELSISDNSITGDIPVWLGEEFRHLKSVDLSDNMLSGEIPASFGKLSTLELLDLSRNNLSSIEFSIIFPSTLELLDLSENQLSGKIPASIGQLPNLMFLDINSNPMEGTLMSESHLANLTNLLQLHIYDTFLTLILPYNWVPPFQLEEFSAATCEINRELPQWLQTQKSLTDLNLSNANINGLMPRWFHSMKLLYRVDLSNNKLIGSPIFPLNFISIDLSHNSLSGEFFSNGSQNNVEYRYASSIDLSNNFFSGPFPQDLSRRMPNLQALVVSNNRIDGVIPKSLCQLSLLSTIDVQKNRLSGVIPKCWANLSSLELLSLSYNKLKGHIPCIYAGNTGNRIYLHLNDNILSGEIPSCLSKLTNLQVLDIGGNQLSGRMPAWITAEKLRALKIIRLRGNKLSGIIPIQICSLFQLQVLDLGHNRFTGSIPSCLINLTAMRSSETDTVWYYDGGDVSEVMQGIEREYTSTLRYLMDIDLSYNYLMGNIPDSITNLSGLFGLNLSYNQLSGTIPENIGGLKSMISLDFSRNNLRGVIPTSIAELYHLSYLNLSYNNLSGQIPTGSQLQTLTDPSIYVGNPDLCGDPLPKKCKTKDDEQDRNRSYQGSDQNEDNKQQKLWLYLFVMSGFATGFWGVVGTLLLKRNWRHALFRRVQAAYDRVYDVVAIKMAKFKKK